MTDQFIPETEQNETISQIFVNGAEIVSVEE
jgi:hypothetical protein